VKSAKPSNERGFQKNMTNLPPNGPPETALRERRIHARKRVEGLIYVELGEENGGIVLNLGEDGLEFHAAMSVQQNQFPRIRFQLPVSGSWAEAKGEIAWANESRTSAGLRFVDLPEEARSEIRDWVLGRIAAPDPPRWGRKSTAIIPEDSLSVSRPELSSPAAVAENLVGEQEPRIEQAPEKEGPDEVLVGAARASADEGQTRGTAVFEAGPGGAASGEVLTGHAEAVEEPAKAEQIPVARVLGEEIAESPVEMIPGTPASSDTDFMATPGAPPAEPLFLLHSLKGAEEEAARGGHSRWVWGGLLVAVAAISFAAGIAVGRHSTFSTLLGSAEISAARKAPPMEAPRETPSSTDSQPPPVTAAEASSGISHSGNGSFVENAAQPVNAPPAPPAAPHASAPSTTVIPTPESENAPSFVELPEEPISASSTIAISATRSIELPPTPEGVSRPRSAQVQPGALLAHAQPDYPLEQMQDQVEGTVKLRVSVARDGTVKQIEPMGGPPALLGTSVAAVKQWRYKPTLLNGKSVEVQEVVTIEFRLPSSVAPAP
jgi:TonB family protein